MFGDGGWTRCSDIRDISGSWDWVEEGRCSVGEFDGWFAGRRGLQSHYKRRISAIMIQKHLSKCHLNPIALMLKPYKTTSAQLLLPDAAAFLDKNPKKLFPFIKKEE
jgi:hypothetical protein